jgi:hypothetical protein
MSGIAARRLLTASTHALVKASHPTLAQVEAVVDALSQVITADTGIACRLVMQIKSGEVEKLKEKLQ